MKILIISGAGYMESHVSKQLLGRTQNGIIILDNLSTNLINLSMMSKFIVRINEKHNPKTYLKLLALKIVLRIKILNICKDLVNSAENSTFLVANNSEILDRMSWKPRFNNFKSVCQSAYKWENVL